MHRVLVMACALAACLTLAACDAGGYYDDRYGYGSYANCEQAATCEACTPIYGCGWCSYGDGRGICLSEPNACRVQQFSWAWEPKGCGSSPDAGLADGATADVATSDAAESSAPDDAANETAEESSDDDGSGGP
jgi:hypothetical protein